MEPLQEGELILLAEDIPHAKYPKLCDTLGFSFARGQSILATDQRDYNVAMQHILMEWKGKQTNVTQSRSVLARELRKIDLGALGDKLSNGAYQRNQGDPRDTEKASLQGCIGSHKKISRSLTIAQCREKLEKVYLNELCKIPMRPWDRNDYAEFKNMHTLVTMVKKDARGKDTRKKEILKGSVAEIFSTKVNDTLPARILVSAPAGRGKTTAVAKIAYDWAHKVQGSALEHLPLLFVLKFRNIGRKTSIGEAIKSQLLSDVDDLTPGDLEIFIRENQRICHIILDGLDEYAGIAANQGLGSNIVDVMLWKTYRECRVLVTTRPHLESFFNQENLPTVYTKMWIEGFSRESSRDYIDKFFASTSNPSQGQGLKAYLDDQPLINELVITPLFCLMVCHLWSEELLKTHTTTQTELLDQVNVFMMHHCNARSKSRNEISEEKLFKIIQKLGKVALVGLLDDAKKLVFTPHDFRRVPNVLKVACELGIISKTTVSPTQLPRSHKTSSSTIEFYHKIAQEHSAGKYLAAKSKKRLWSWQTSLLLRVLSKIESNICDYENLIRFAAGSENNLCITIMEALLANSHLDESERYRILLDCSSETSSTEETVSSLIQRCVTAQSMVLKSPSVYTVVGMQNLPELLKSQIRKVKFEDSDISADVTSGLWSCLGSFPSLRNLTISDSSLCFPLPPPELQSITKLVAARVTSHSYEGLLQSLPSVEEIEVTIDDAERDIHVPHITAGLHSLSRTEGQQLTRIALEAPTSLHPEKKKVSGETIRQLGVLIREQTENLQMLLVSGVNSGDEEDLVALSECCRHAKALHCLIFLGCGSNRGGKLESYAKDLLISKERLRVIVLNERDQLAIEKCYLSTEMTIRLWSSLRFLTSLNHLFISDSSLSFPPSPPELTSVIKLKAERVTSQSYEGLLSSLPALEEIDITIGDAERDISQITAGLRRTGGQQLTRIALEAAAPLPLEKKKVSREMMRELDLLIREHIKSLKSLRVSGVECLDEDLVAIIECSKILPRLHFQFLGWGYLDYNPQFHRVTLGDCQLSTEMTIRLWTCLKSFQPSLSSLTISDSSLSFPPSPPELTSVTKVEAKRVTSQSYEGLLSSLPGLEEIDISIDNAERDIGLSHITTVLRRTRGQQLTGISLCAAYSLPHDKKSRNSHLPEKTVSRETMRLLRLLIREITKNLHKLFLYRVKCTDEEDLVYLIECCRHVKAMAYVELYLCGTQEGGKLESHLKRLHALGYQLRVDVTNDTGVRYRYEISHSH